jgi:hypothetical protein
MVGDAVEVAKTLDAGDLVFVDPPYSSVQYSRFYHVLETVAHGRYNGAFLGVGRYPPIANRPQSRFSNTQDSLDAISELLSALKTTRCTVVLTFRRGSASNGLSGTRIRNLARRWFEVEDHSTVRGSFSTLGGNKQHRDARQRSSEMILVLRPMRGTT